MAKTQSKEIRRAQIIEAAAKCFGEKGYDRTTMGDIVASSGLSKGSLYWHFNNKEAIFLALFDSYESRVLSTWRKDNNIDPVTFVKTRGAFAVKLMLSEPLYLNNWFEFLLHPLVKARMDRVQASYRQVIRETLQPAYSNADKLAALIVAMLDGLFMQAIDDPDFDALDVWEVGIDRLLH